MGLFRVVWRVVVTMAFVGVQVSFADDRIPVAISYFDNTSNKAELDPLKKGMAEMLITDLSISKDIKLVERERLNDVMKELDLQKSPFVDQSSAAKLGKGLGAAYIVTGSYIVSGDTMRVDSRMIDVETNEIAIAAKAEGPTTDFLAIERSLATQLLEGLGGSLSLVEKKKIGANGTGNLNALTAYSNGLDAMDSGDLDAANKALAKAVGADPEFKAAQALRERIDAMAKAFDMSLYTQQTDSISRFFAGNDCACSYAKPQSELEDKSYNAQLGYRLFHMQQGEYHMAFAGPKGWVQSLKIALQMAQIGQFEQAESLLEALNSEEFYAAGAYSVMPGVGLKDDGETVATTFQPVAKCVSYQVRSYVHLMQLELEEAMAWQLKAVEMPEHQFKATCLAGAQLGLLGIPQSKPLKETIQETIDDPAVHKKWKDQRDVLKQVADKAWDQIDATMQSPPPCEELCPWTPKDKE